MNGASVALALTLLLNAGCAERHGFDERIIDTHIHLYDTTRPQGVPWPGKNDAALYRPHLPAHYEPVAKSNGVTAAVIVEASEWIEDNQWVLDLIDREPRYIALVGNLLPGSDGFAASVDRFAKHPKFVGIRPRIDRPLKLTDERVLADLALLASKGLALDMIAGGGTGDEGVLAQLAVVAKRIPSLTIVINHLGGVTIDGRQPDPKWVERIAACARHRNVYCKLSALDQQKGRPVSAEADSYVPVLDVLWKEFGADRLMYGSNWPVSTVHIGFAEQQAIIRQYVESRDPSAVEKIFFRNAVRAYQLEP